MVLYFLSYIKSMIWSMSSFNAASVFKLEVNWDSNSPPANRLFVRCAALLISLFIPVLHIHAQTQAVMNTQARAEFARADAELNKSYERF